MGRARRVEADSSREAEISLVRAVAVRSGIGSSELLECARRGRKLLYGSPDFRREVERDGTPKERVYRSAWALTK